MKEKISIAERIIRSFQDVDFYTMTMGEIQIKEIVKRYFESAERRDLEAVNSLFAEDVEIYFPHTGIVRGIEGLKKLNLDFATLLRQIKFHMDEFVYTYSENRIIVEGVESGLYADGKQFKKERFCSVFEFENGLIKRMYAYPNLNF